MSRCWRPPTSSTTTEISTTTESELTTTNVEESTTTKNVETTNTDYLTQATGNVLKIIRSYKVSNLMN